MGLGSRGHKEEQQDAGERKDDDFEQLQAAAMQRVNSKKVVVPTASRKNIQEVDVRKLTRSQKNRILDAGLQVTVFEVLNTAPYCLLASAIAAMCCSVLASCGTNHAYLVSTSPLSVCLWCCRAKIMMLKGFLARSRSAWTGTKAMALRQTAVSSCIWLFATDQHIQIVQHVNLTLMYLCPLQGWH